MPMYRNKPGQIEARQVNSADAAATTDLIAWCRGVDATGDTPPHVLKIDVNGVSTGLDDGDWVVRTDGGIFYRCNAQIFALVFEHVA